MNKLFYAIIGFAIFASPATAQVGPPGPRPPVNQQGQAQGQIGIQDNDNDARATNRNVGNNDAQFSDSIGNVGNVSGPLFTIDDRSTSLELQPLQNSFANHCQRPGLSVGYASYLGDETIHAPQVMLSVPLGYDTCAAIEALNIEMMLLQSCIALQGTDVNYDQLGGGLDRCPAILATQ